MTGRGTRRCSGFAVVSAGRRGLCVRPDARGGSELVCEGAGRKGASCRGIAAGAAGASENVTCGLRETPQTSHVACFRAGHMCHKRMCPGALSLGTCTRVQGVSIVYLTGTCVGSLE